MSGIHPGLVIGIPFCGRPVAPEWALSMATQNFPMGMNTMYITLKGVEVGEARDRIVEQALEHGAKYIWFVDDDTAPPHFAIKKLVKVLEETPDAAVCAGIYCSRLPEGQSEPIVFKKVGEGVFWRWKVNEIFECEGIGTGCMLIRADVFRKLEKPWFVTSDKDCSGSNNIVAEKETDDLYFCRKLIAAGYKIMAHGGVLPVHWDASTGIPYMLPEGSYPVKTQDCIDQAMEIKGWMDKPELIWLADQAKKHRNIVELGSFLGRSTRVLAESTKGTVTAVDDWEGPRGTASYMPGNPLIFDTFKNNLQDKIDAGVVLIRKERHEDIIPDQQYDMVFVDGDHSYEGVKRDLEKWLPALTPGGLICGHDSDMQSVKQALTDHLPQAEFLTGTRIWYYETPPARIGKVIAIDTKEEVTL